MKKILATLLSLALLFSMTIPALAADDAANTAADALHALGLFHGTGTDANSKPIYDLNRAPTRAEAVTMLVRLLGKGTEAEGGTWETPFTDVEEWAKPYIGYAYTNKLTSGTSATTFGGASNMTATQYITLVLRALGYASGSDFRWDAAWELSDKLGVTHGSYSEKTDTFTRGDVAKVSFDSLSAARKDTDETLIENLVSTGAVEGALALQQGLDCYGWLDSIHYIYDIRTFTLYAYMNYIGYDDNNGYPITGVRAALREELEGMDIKLAYPASFKEFDDVNYSHALRALGSAPEFRYQSGTHIPQGMSNLPSRLKDFYEKVNIPSLYEKYRPEYETALAEYRQVTAQNLIPLLAYLRVSEIAPVKFGVEVNLLDAYSRGSGLGIQDAFYGYGVIRTGPSNTPNILNILHEYTHGLTNPILSKLQSHVSSLSKYHKTGTKAYSQGYTSWKENVEEAFVRAISIYFTDGYDRALAQRNEADGFTMTLYIYDRLDEFESFEGNLQDFIKTLLVEYPEYVQGSSLAN